MQLLSFCKLTKALSEPLRCSVSHGAGSDCNSRDILQMLTQGPEKTNGKSRNAPAGNAPAGKPPLFVMCIVSESVRSSSRLHTHPITKNAGLAEPPDFLCQASGFRHLEGCGVLLGVSSGLHSSGFLLFGVCVFPEKLLDHRLHPSFTNARGHAQTHT